MRARGWLVLLLLAVPAAGDERIRQQLKYGMLLLRSSDENSRYRGARKLRDLGPAAAPAAPLLVKHLRDSSGGVRDMVQATLVVIGKQAVPALARGMKSRDPWLRTAIAETLQKIGRDAGKHHKLLLPFLKDKQVAVRTSIADTLGKIGEPALKGLMRALGRNSPEQRAAAARALAAMGSIAVPALRAALPAKSALLRAGAAHALGLIGSWAASANEELLAALLDGNAEVRARAAFAVGRTKGAAEKILPALLRAMADEARAVQRAAVDAATRFGAAAAPFLVKALADTEGAARRAGIEALARLRTPAVELLNEGLKSPNPRARAGAARALGAMDTLVKVYVDGLTDLLGDDVARVRRAAALAIADRAGRAGTTAQALCKALQDKQAPVRTAAAFALGEVAEGEPETIVALEAALKDADSAVKITAALALWRLGGSPTPPVELALTLLQGTDPRAQTAALGALGLMGRAAEPALPALVELLESDQAAFHAPAVNALGALASSHGAGVLGRAGRYAAAPKATRTVIEAALQWLVRVQDTKASGVNEADGRWHPSEFVKHHAGGHLRGRGGPLYSGGITGLALSAFLAVGYTDSGPNNPYRAHVREGLGFLVASQQGSGCLSNNRSQHFLISHAFATAALCEAWILTGNPRYGRVAQRALDFCCAARNPGRAWRYEPRGGENDTNVTAVMLSALRLGELGGLRVDAQAIVDGDAWIEDMTEPSYNIGYNMRGGSCARPEGLQEKFPVDKSGAMTAAGLWGRHMAAMPLRNTPEADSAALVCRELPPSWSHDGSIDMYYWHYGTLVFWQRGGKDWEFWTSRLDAALLGHQRKGDPRPFAGSWDPCGPWGRDGGRIYSTALNALTLATPYRFESGFMRARPPVPYRAAAAALAGASSNKQLDPDVRASAAAWLRQARRE